MQKIFMLCLVGALALATTSCKEDKKTITLQTITVNGQMYEVKSAFYADEPADAEDEAAFELGLFPTELTAVPEEEPDFYVTIDMSESLYGKTIDLTKPLVQGTMPWPYLCITAKNGSSKISIDFDEDWIAGKVTAGKLTVTKNGDKFTVELSVTLSDGQFISAAWTGKATKMEIPG